MYDNNEIYKDINKNNKWDYGNLDNIKEFTVPKKGDIISFDKIDNWEHVINLLILDGNKVEIGDWELTVVDPKEIARLSGIIKYKIFELIGPESIKIDSLKEKVDKLCESTENCHTPPVKSCSKEKPFLHYGKTSF